MAQHALKNLQLAAGVEISSLLWLAMAPNV